MSRRLTWGLGFMAVALLLLGMWAYSRLEFVTKDIELPPRGEAARNPLYATQTLFRHLGSTVINPIKEAKKPLLPAAGGIFYLDAPSQAQALDQGRALEGWVASGGHLLVSSRWVQSLPRSDQNASNPSKKNQVRPEPFILAWIPVVAQVESIGLKGCNTLSEGGEFQYYPNLKNLTSCLSFSHTLKTRQRPLWGLRSGQEWVAVRVPWGQGSITVFSECNCRGPVQEIFSNAALEKADHALMATALFQAGPGQNIWWAHDPPQRPSFIRWIWQQAWIVVLLFGLAVVGGLWRGARRFGPPMALAQPVRRSMGEQIHGNAAFLQRHGGHALHGATLQALERAAKAYVRVDKNASMESRAQAIATLTGLPADRLAEACLPRDPSRTPHGPEALQLLEMARRRLIKLSPGAPAPTPAPLPSSGASKHADSP